MRLVFAHAGRLLLIAAALLLSGAALARSPSPAQSVEHGATESGHAEAEHGGEAAHHFNLFYGVLGEQGGALCGLLHQEPGHPPNLLCRQPGQPVPFGALLINVALLFWGFWAFGRRPLREGLRRRRTSIQRAMDEARRMRDEAAARLADYQDRLQHIDDEIDRVRRETSAAGEAERTRILAEAREKRDRMQRDAKLVIDQEMKAAREQLRAELVRSASESAREVLSKHVTSADQARIGEEYLETVSQAAGLPGGRA